MNINEQTVMKDYYVAINLRTKDVAICTTKVGAARFLEISTDTIDRRMNEYNYSSKKNEWIVFFGIPVTKSNNKGNLDNLVSTDNTAL